MNLMGIFQNLWYQENLNLVFPVPPLLQFKVQSFQYHFGPLKYFVLLIKEKQRDEMTGFIATSYLWLMN